MENDTENVDENNISIEDLIAIGYKKVSRQTFISDLVLEEFLNKNFKGINRTRAFGIIQILEREYNVDLSDLKAAYIESEDTKTVSKTQKLFLEKPIPSKEEWKKYIKYIFGLFALLGLAYLFVDLSNTKVNNTEVLIEKVEENKSIIDKTQKKLKRLEENKTALEEKQDNNISLFVVSDDEKEDFDFDEVVFKMITERNITVSDQNVSSNAKDVNKTVALTTQTISKPKEQEKKVVKGNFYIKPKKRAWVGIIYLDNYTKKDFLIHSKLPLDSSRDQLIVIGHKFFDIYNKNYSINFIGKGPIRFIYRDGELMEINKKEFKRSSAGVSW